jgi:CDP-diacylglycerol--glycerol-3-phosphate 3-phosphatidyltransferase
MESAESAPKMDLIGTSRWALGANALTIFRFFSAPVLAWMILDTNPWWLSFWFGWFLGATDLFDGRLARRAVPTKFGAFFDPLADKFVVILAGYALVEVGVFGWIPMTLILIREVGIQLYRTYWGRHGLSIPARPSGKYKVFVQGLAIVAGVFPPFEDRLWIPSAVLWVAVVFTLVSGMQYVLDGRDALRTTGAR